jgi:hypothetical protein
MAHAQKPDFVFWRNRRVHLNRRGCQFSLLLAAEVCDSSVVMLDAPCSEVVWRVLPTHSIRQFPLHIPSRASPCATKFQLDSTTLLFLSLSARWGWVVNVMPWPLYPLQRPDTLCIVLYSNDFSSQPGCVLPENYALAFCSYFQYWY